MLPLSDACHAFFRMLRRRHMTAGRYFASSLSLLFARFVIFAMLRLPLLMTPLPRHVIAITPLRRHYDEFAG